MTSRTDHDHGGGGGEWCVGADHGHHQNADKHGAILRDPVCGMEVHTGTAAHKLQLGDASYYFCSARCLEKFRARSDRYLNPPAVDPAVPSPALGALPEVAEGTIWTCPMHPQIRRNGPGQCPICGMALEPLEPTREEGPNPELIDMTKRFWVSAALSLPLAVIAMGMELLGWRLLSMRTGIETVSCRLG